MRIITLCLLVVSLGCASGIRTTQGRNASLIVGYIDVTQAPGKLASVYVIQDEKAGIAYRNGKIRTFPDGLFFIENVPPMRYNIAWFMLGGKRHVISTSEKDLVRVKPRSIHFLGAFKYQPGKRDLATATGLKNETYSLVPQKGQLKKVMRMLHPHLKDPRWKKRVKALL